MILPTLKLLFNLSAILHFPTLLFFGITWYLIYRDRSQPFENGLLYLFGALTIERLWSFLAGILISADFIYPVFVARNIIHIFIISALILMVRVVYKERKK